MARTQPVSATQRCLPSTFIAARITILWSYVSRAARLWFGAYRQIGFPWRDLRTIHWWSPLANPEQMAQNLLGLLVNALCACLRACCAQSRLGSILRLVSAPYKLHSVAPSFTNPFEPLQYHLFVCLSRHCALGHAGPLYLLSVKLSVVFSLFIVARLIGLYWLRYLLP